MKYMLFGDYLGKTVGLDWVKAELVLVVEGGVHAV